MATRNGYIEIKGRKDFAAPNTGNAAARRHELGATVGKIQIIASAGQVYFEAGDSTVDATTASIGVAPLGSAFVYEVQGTHISVKTDADFDLIVLEVS